ncbi:MAG TPA: SDR family oxidoreductase [Rhizomicrobium sp.]|jgi:nucleoside-diphosphate-sugar epimerase|nr:SDR family oxidoreductase [Rhizomicrobium sp.]
MRVFVTGATGFVGSVTVPELIAAGHKVVGLARSEANEKALAAMGADVHRGSLEDVESLKQGAAASDGVIHLGFNHDFSKWAENGQMDKRAIEAMGEALAGSDRPLIVTSGTALVAPGRVATEDMRNPHAEGIPRVSEQTADAVHEKHDVRTMAIRLAPTTHGKGDKGFVPMIIGVARAKGVSAYVGDGKNRWTAVHRRDAATLYRLALEKGTGGAIYHGVAEESVAFRDIATVIGKRLNIPVVSKTQEEAMEHFGFFGMFASIDIPASSTKTKAELGWTPTHTSLLTDMEENYF